MIYRIVNALQKLVSNKPQPQKTGKAISPVDSDIDWGVPTEIVGQLPSAPELEHSMLPKLIADYAFEQARLLDNAPPVFCATSIIATAAALIGGSVTISPKRFAKEWKLKPIIWQVNIGGPSTKKTPCQKVGLDLFTHAINTVIEPANEELRKQFEVRELASKAKAGQLKSQAEKHLQDGDEKAAEKIYSQINQLAQTPPIYRKPLINEATIEALIKRVSSNPLGILMCRDELYGWISELEKADNAEERSFYNEAFNGSGSFELERIGRGTNKLEDPTIFVMGNIQPDRLQPLITGRAKGKSNDGLFERFQLIVFPDSNNKKYVDVKPDYKLKNSMKALFVKLAHLGTPDRYSNPLMFDFTEEAQTVWDTWAPKLIEIEKKATYDDQTILGKHAAFVAKLALVFHLLCEAEKCECLIGFKPSTKVSRSALDLAIKWSDFVFKHSQKVRAIGNSVSVAIESALNLKDKLFLLPHNFSHRDLQRKGWKGLKTPKEISDALEVLITHGYIKQHMSIGLNGKSCIRFIVHPEFR